MLKITRFGGTELPESHQQSESAFVSWLYDQVSGTGNYGISQALDGRLVLAADSLEKVAIIGPDPHLSVRSVKAINCEEYVQRFAAEVEQRTEGGEPDDMTLFAARKLATTGVTYPKMLKEMSELRLRCQAEAEPREAWDIKFIRRPYCVETTHFGDATLNGVPRQSLDFVTNATGEKFADEHELTVALANLKQLIFVGRDNPITSGKAFRESYIHRADETGHAFKMLIERDLRSNVNISRNTRFSEQAYSIAKWLMEQLPVIRAEVNSDIAHACKNDPAIRETSAIELTHNGIQAIWRYRVANRLFRRGVRRLSQMIQLGAIRETGVDIHPGASIASPFFIDHGVATVIGETCEIGPGCVLYAAVILGSAKFPKGENGDFRRDVKRHPTIGANCTIYSGARVLGPITIGEGSTIGIDETVWTDMPPKYKKTRNRDPRPLDEDHA